MKEERKNAELRKYVYDGVVYEITEVEFDALLHGFEEPRDKFG